MTQSWRFEIPTPVYSQNHLRDARRYKHAHKYKKLRDQYRWDVRIAASNAGVTKATGKRRVDVIRMYTGRAQEYDPLNLFGGAKPLIDALVLEGLLVDDNGSDMELGEWGQCRGDRTATVIRLEEIDA